MAVAQFASMKQEPPDPDSLPPPVFPPLLQTQSSEPVDPVDLEERILALCANNPKGITDEILTQDQPLIDTAKRLKALQRLLSQGKIDLLKQGSTLVYRLKATNSSPNKTKGFEREERLVYQIIEDAGNKGIWIRELRIKSNLMQAQLARTVKTLESKKLIKSVKSVQAAKRRLYMLYDLTPDESITGGAWYSDQDFESEFVEILNRHCLKFLQQKAFKAEATHKDPISRKSASYSSANDVCKFITELGISKVRLTVENIETILNTLLYDGHAEVTVVAGQSEDGEEELQRLYRSTKPFLQDTGFSRVPCGVCSVIDQCCDGGAVSPLKCVYMKEWLKF